MESVFGSQSRSFNFDAFKNLDHISPAVQSHLKQVYLTLCSALVLSAFGVYLHILWNVGGVLTMVACLGCMIWLLATHPHPHEERKRLGLLGAFSVFEGMTIGPLIKLAVEVDSSILVTAFVGCAIAFGCFSAAAMYARRREFLYLGAFLSAGFSILMWVRLASYLFGGGAAFYNFELYWGLVVFVGYIVFDTQDIIEKAHSGDQDYVKHAVLLFTDFVSVFVRILIIMLKNSEKEKEERKKKRRD